MRRERTYTWIDPRTTSKEMGKGLTGYESLMAIMNGDIAPPPMAETLDFHLHKVERGRVVFRSQPQDFHYNPIGSVHGGYYGTLLDSCMSCAIHSLLEQSTGYTTLEYKVNIVRAIGADVSEVFAEGNIVHLGRRIATADGKITDAKGKLYAHGTVTCIVLNQ